MGDVGKSIIKLRDMRDELISNAANYDEIVRQFASIGVARIPGEIAPTPWSILGPGVYARMLDKAGYQTPGVLQLRVTRQAVAAEGVQVASVGRGWQRAMTVKVVPPTSDRDGRISGRGGSGARMESRTRWTRQTTEFLAVAVLREAAAPLAVVGVEADPGRGQATKMTQAIHHHRAILPTTCSASTRVPCSETAHPA